MPATDVHHAWIKDISGGQFDPIACIANASATGMPAPQSPAGASLAAAFGGTDEFDHQLHPTSLSLPVFVESAKNAAPTGGKTGGAASGKEPEPDLSEQAIDAVLKDPKKRAEELLKRGIPRFSDKYDADTPRTQFFDDVESGIKKAQEYVGYMGQVADYALKYGKGLEKIAEVGTGLKAIADKLKGGLGKAGKAVAKAKQVSEFADAVEDFAGVCRTLDMKHIENVQHWADSMENLWNKTSPIIDWVKDKATDAAIADGSELGGAVSASISIVAAQFVLGVKTLKQGLKNEKDYIDKLKSRVHEIEVFSGQRPPDPPPPAAPPPWESREDEAQRVRTSEDAQLRRSMEDERSRKAAQKAHDEDVAEREAAAKKAAEAKAAQKARDEAEAEFLHKTFVVAYQSARPGFYRTLHKSAMSENSGDTEIGWWECLTFDEKENLRLVNSQDDSMIARVGPRKTHVSNSEASAEIANFFALANKFQPVIDLYWKEHGKAFPASGASH